ncbi:hypothetical protein IFM89_022994 [Coptis chinensis]|uniref:Uncharacterized protein n=1 Tax=Coptis chinensis TaxID=261450 RepID=A0A835IGL0_9MAGN|nr:hypothetical protein IFM89_022994 [Coptis chinensis]
MSKKHQTTPSVDSEPAQNKSGSHRSSMTSEGYISFCFKGNGSFYVVKDRKSQISSDSLECTSTRTRRKLRYEENVDNFKEDGIDLEATSKRESYYGKGEEEEEESIYFDPESSAQGITEEPYDENEEYEYDGNEDYQYDENEDYQPISHESSASNDSAGSFAFPALNRVWSGSPIKMPRTKGAHLRKHKDWRLVLLCCRF